MARIGGRSLWLAVPVGLLCAGVVAALVYLAAPMMPVAVQWVGDTLRATAEEARAEAAEPSPAERVASDTVLDCRDVYPDDLWAELIWRGDVLLDQDAALPALSSSGLVDALAPSVSLTCTWNFGDGGSISSTISTVAPEAAGVAEAALAAHGLSCGMDAGALMCAGSGESHVFRDGLWLASVHAQWAPPEYDSRLASFVWG